MSSPRISTIGEARKRTEPKSYPFKLKKLKRKPRIRWVKPTGKYARPYVSGYTFGREVAMVEGKATPLTEAHEIGHIELGHPEPKSFKQMVNQEIQTNLLTYSRTKLPKRFISYLRAIHLDWRGYRGMSPDKAMSQMAQVAKQYVPYMPKAWVTDLEQYKQEYAESAARFADTVKKAKAKGYGVRLRPFPYYDYELYRDGKRKVVVTSGLTHGELRKALGSKCTVPNVLMGAE